MDLVNLFDIKIVLMEPLYEANVGYVARVMKNFGLRDLRIVKPQVQLGRKSRIFAAHAKDIIDGAQILESLGDAVKNSNIVIGTTARPGKSTRNVLRSATSPTTVVEKVVSSRGKVAIIFGRDTTGLSNEELDLCDVVLTIPTSREYPTMNLSHAATVIFYELFKAYSMSDGPREAFSDKKSLNKLMGFFDEMTARSKLPAHKRTLAKRAFHNIVFRSFMTRRETSLLMGVFRKNLRLTDKYFRRLPVEKPSKSLYNDIRALC